MTTNSLLAMRLYKELRRRGADRERARTLAEEVATSITWTDREHD